MNQTKQATFQVTENRKDIFLVVRLEKVLMGDMETGSSIYFRSTVKPKEKAKYVALVDSSGQRLGAYTQSFGLGVIPLFKDDDTPIYGDIRRSTMLDKIVRLSGDTSDDSLFKNIKSLLAEKLSVRIHQKYSFLFTSYTFCLFRNLKFIPFLFILNFKEKKNLYLVNGRPL